MTEFEPVVFDIETTGLNPLAQEWQSYQSHDAQVIAIGIGTFDDWWDKDSFDGDVSVLYGEDEYELLEDIREKMVEVASSIEDRGREPFLVTWNGRNYDHPYLGARYARYRQPPYPFCHALKRLDLFRMVLSATGQYRKQEDYAEELGVGTEDEFDGSDMPDMFDDRNWDAIIQHARQDVVELMQIAMVEREKCMGHFYDHYDIMRDPESDFAENIEL